MSTVHQLKKNTIQCLFIIEILSLHEWCYCLLYVSVSAFLSLFQSICLSLCFFSLNLSLHNTDIHIHSQRESCNYLKWNDCLLIVNYFSVWIMSNCSTLLNLNHLFRYEQKQRWDKIKIPYFTFGCRLTGQCYVLEITSL